MYKMNVVLQYRRTFLYFTLTVVIDPVKRVVRNRYLVDAQHKPYATK
jgi:hypothetical protein